MAKLNCSCGKSKDDCCPFRKIVIPAVMGDDSEDSPSAPENGAYVNALVEYEANGAMYMYASDGIFTKLSMVAGSAGAATVDYVDKQDAKMLSDAKTYADSIVPTVDVTKAYVDQQDAKTVVDAKAYADSIVPTVDVTKAYVDQQDAGTLEEAKAYTDAHSSGGSEAMYVDLTITEFGETTVGATANKTVTEVANAISAGGVVLYRVVLPQSIPSLGLNAGTYLFRPDYVSEVGVIATPTSWTSVPVAVQLIHENSTSVTIQFEQVDSIIENVATPIVNSTVSTAITQANVPVITLSNTDIAEGSALPANNFYGVYIEGSK